MPATYKVAAAAATAMCGRVPPLVAGSTINTPNVAAATGQVERPRAPSNTVAPAAVANDVA